MGVDSNVIGNTFMGEICNFVTPKRKSSKKQLLKISIRPFSFETLRLKKFVQKKELEAQKTGRKRG